MSSLEKLQLKISQWREIHEALKIENTKLKEELELERDHEYYRPRTAF